MIVKLPIMEAKNLLDHATKDFALKYRKRIRSEEYGYLEGDPENFLEYLDTLQEDGFMSQATIGQRRRWWFRGS